MSIDYRELKPYRVEWRPDLVTKWILLESVDTHDEAMAKLEEKEHGGQRRVISQHVIAGRGLGAETF